MKIVPGAARRTSQTAKTGTAATGYDTGAMSCDMKPPSLGTLDLIRKREPGKSITAGRINKQIHIAYAGVVF